MTVSPAYKNTDFCVASAIADAKVIAMAHIGHKMIELDSVPVSAASAGHESMLAMFHPITGSAQVRSMLLASELRLGGGLSSEIGGCVDMVQEHVSPGLTSNADHNMAQHQAAQEGTIKV